MSKDWVADIIAQDKHYNMTDAVEKMTGEQLLEFLKFRIRFLDEELTEIKDGTCPDDIIDGIIDLCVVGIGTLTAFKADPYDAWDRVLDANMKKKVGIKEGRPNPLGLPDLMKPEGWVGPDHSKNRSFLDYVFLERWIKGDLSK